jgi:hypothetical protein
METNNNQVLNPFRSMKLDWVEAANRRERKSQTEWTVIVRCTMASLMLCCKRRRKTKVKPKSRLFAALIAISIMAAPIAANAETHRDAEAHAAAARAAASRNSSQTPRFAAARTMAQRDPVRKFQARQNGRNLALQNRGNWERNAARSQVDNRYLNQYAYQPRGYYNGNPYNGYNNYAAPMPLQNNCELGAYPSAYAEPGYGYGQSGYGEGRPALMAYRGRLLAQKVSIEQQLSSGSNFMEYPYLHEQLSEVNKKLGDVNSKLGIAGSGYAMGRGGSGYDGYQQASPLAALTGLGGNGGYYGNNRYNGYGANPYYGQQGGLASALPMLGNFIH